MHRVIQIFEVILGIASLVVMGLTCSPEEVVDDIVDRLARGELEPVIELLKGGE